MKNKRGLSRALLLSNKIFFHGNPHPMELPSIIEFMHVKNVESHYTGHSRATSNHNLEQFPAHIKGLRLENDLSEKALSHRLY